MFEITIEEDGSITIAHIEAKVSVSIPAGLMRDSEGNTLQLDPFGRDYHEYQTGFDIPLEPIKSSIFGLDGVTYDLLTIPTIENVAAAVRQQPAPELQDLPPFDEIFPVPNALTPEVKSGTRSSLFTPPPANFFFDNDVTHIVSEDGRIVVNTTEPSHMFHYGIVVRVTYESSPNIATVDTLGIGNSSMSGIFGQLSRIANNSIGEGVFEDPTVIAHQTEMNGIHEHWEDVRPYDSFGNPLPHNPLPHNDFGAGSSNGPSNGHIPNGGFDHSGSGTKTTGSGWTPSDEDWEGGNGNQDHGTPDPSLPVNPDYVGISPILLDLDGTGVRLTELSESTQYFDSGNSGLKHKTAWAGAGDGVLFFDPNARDAITETRQYVFTEWDPGASSDLEALRSAFDSNGDGKLNSADADFAKFKVLVTKADGSTEVKTLADLNITEIDLTGDATQIELPDGSLITGQTTFKRGDGTTGTVADATLASEAVCYRVDEVVSAALRSAK